jgi:IMP dehydrogenase
MNVADAMTPRADLVTVALPGTRDDVLEYLQDRAFSSVPVVKEEDGEEIYRGLVSREVLIDQPAEDQLAMLMEDVPTTTTDASIQAAAALMVAEEARRVPVVDGETLQGIVTVTDVVRAIADGDATGAVHADEIMEAAVNTSYEGAPLPVVEREIAYAQDPYSIMLDDDGKMSGMLTEVDIIDVARVVEGEDDVGSSIANEDDDWMWEGIKAVGNRYFPTRDVEIPAGPAREFMTADLVTTSGRKTAQEVAQLMLTNDVEQIPLVSGDNLIGIVRDMDLLEGV